MVVAVRRNSARPYYLDASRAVTVHRDQFPDDEEHQQVFQQLADRKAQVEPEQQRFAELCDRWDNLYFPDDVLQHAGASHWADHPTARTRGMAHVSVNSPPVYVDIPASLQSVPPVENMVSNLPSDEGRQMASMAERIYFAWKEEEDWELKGHEACITKGLYGHTAAKVYWDDTKNRPCVTIVDQPRNLYLGWSSSDYRDLNWALYCYALSPESVYEEWGLLTDSMEEEGGNIIPFVLPADRLGNTSRRVWSGQTAVIEVYDYWYRKPKTKQRKGNRYKAVQFETWNAIFVGNVCVKNEVHTEYDGKMPYVPLMNTYIPGVPSGRPELFDVEPLIREKDERMSAGAQMLGKTIDGQYWQLVGPEAPDTVPNGVQPKPNKVVAPGAGNRIEAIQPWMPEFQLEQYLTRIDREMADVTGLNDLLRGLAPSTVLSSSKAITALVANYEARIRIKRDLYYVWRREVWTLAQEVWAQKNTVLRPVLSGIARLQATPPSLTPRDDMETAAMVANLVNAKLWALKRGMDRVGVDDPEVEVDIIRAERTDATMFPSEVQTMAQLMSILQSLGYAAPPGAQQQAGGQAESLAMLRQQFGGYTGQASLNSPEEQIATPPEALPSNAEGSVEGGPQRVQTMVQGGEATGRILSETVIE